MEGNQVGNSAFMVHVDHQKNPITACNFHPFTNGRKLHPYGPFFVDVWEVYKKSGRSSTQ
jgi:hypothetical protein